MTPISDEELDAYAMKLIEDRGRAAHIAAALLQSVELRQRFEVRQQLLAAARAAIDDEAESMTTPSDDFEARLWTRIESALPTQIDAPPHNRFAIVAVAAGVLLSVAAVAGFWAGKNAAKQPPVALGRQPEGAIEKPAPLLATNAADRILLERLTIHFAETVKLIEGQQALKEDAQAQVVADQVLQFNRLYALAARRAGHTQLALVLEELEPELQTMSEKQVTREAGARAASQEQLAFKVRVAQDAAQQMAASQRADSQR
jgi:hypothetical protein